MLNKFLMNYYKLMETVNVSNVKQQLLNEYQQIMEFTYVYNVLEFIEDMVQMLVILNQQIWIHGHKNNQKQLNKEVIVNQGNFQKNLNIQKIQNLLKYLNQRVWLITETKQDALLMVIVCLKRYLLKKHMKQFHIIILYLTRWFKKNNKNQTIKSLMTYQVKLRIFEMFLVLKLQNIQKKPTIQQLITQNKLIIIPQIKRNKYLIKLRIRNFKVMQNKRLLIYLRKLKTLQNQVQAHQNRVSIKDGDLQIVKLIKINNKIIISKMIIDLYFNKFTKTRHTIKNYIYYNNYYVDRRNEREIISVCQKSFTRVSIFILRENEDDINQLNNFIFESIEDMQIQLDQLKLQKDHFKEQLIGVIDNIFTQDLNDITQKIYDILLSFTDKKQVNLYKNTYKSRDSLSDSGSNRSNSPVKKKEFKSISEKIQHKQHDKDKSKKNKKDHKQQNDQQIQFMFQMYQQMQQQQNIQNVQGRKDQKFIVYMTNLPAEHNKLDKVVKFFSRYGELVSASVNVQESSANVEFKFKAEMLACCNSQEKYFGIKEVIIGLKPGVAFVPKSQLKQQQQSKESDIQKVQKTDQDQPNDEDLKAAEEKQKQIQENLKKDKEAKQQKREFDQEKKGLSTHIATKFQLLLQLKAREKEQSQQERITSFITNFKQQKQILEKSKDLNDIKQIKEHELFQNDLFDTTLIISNIPDSQLNYTAVRTKYNEFGKIETIKLNKDQTFTLKFADFLVAEKVFFSEEQYKVEFQNKAVMEFLKKPQQN